MLPSTRLCSTPVGVIEAVTEEDGAAKGQAKRCSTPVGVIEAVTTCNEGCHVHGFSGAQRLSASSRRSPADVTCGAFQGPRAQRLSASSRRSRVHGCPGDTAAA